MNCSEMCEKNSSVEMDYGDLLKILKTEDQHLCLDSIHKSHCSLNVELASAHTTVPRTAPYIATHALNDNHGVTLMAVDMVSCASTGSKSNAFSLLMKASHKMFDNVSNYVESMDGTSCAIVDEDASEINDISNDHANVAVHGTSHIVTSNLSDITKYFSRNCKGSLQKTCPVVLSQIRNDAHSASVVDTNACRAVSTVPQTANSIVINRDSCNKEIGFSGSMLKVSDDCKSDPLKIKVGAAMQPSTFVDLTEDKSLMLDTCTNDNNSPTVEHCVKFHDTSQKKSQSFFSTGTGLLSTAVSLAKKPYMKQTHTKLKNASRCGYADQIDNCLAERKYAGITKKSNLRRYASFHLEEFPNRHVSFRKTSVCLPKRNEYYINADVSETNSMLKSAVDENFNESIYKCDLKHHKHTGRMTLLLRKDKRLSTDKHFHASNAHPRRSSPRLANKKVRIDKGCGEMHKQIVDGDAQDMIGDVICIDDSSIEARTFTVQSRCHSGKPYSIQHSLQNKLRHKQGRQPVQMLAPIFCKARSVNPTESNVPTVVSETDCKKREFLLSGVSIEFKHHSPCVELESSCSAFVPFPAVSHVQQILSPGDCSANVQNLPQLKVVDLCSRNNDDASVLPDRMFDWSWHSLNYSFGPKLSDEWTFSPCQAFPPDVERMLIRKFYQRDHSFAFDSVCNRVKTQLYDNCFLSLTADGQWSEILEPRAATEMIGNERCVKELKLWLQEWKRLIQRDSALSCHTAGNPLSLDPDSSISCDSIGDCDDDTCNTMLLQGPHGVGKTAVVYALANQLNYKVFEVNASSSRKGQNIIHCLKEATQSHRMAQKKSNISTVYQTTGSNYSDCVRGSKKNLDFQQKPPDTRIRSCITGTEQDHTGHLNLTLTSLILFDESSISNYLLSLCLAVGVRTCPAEMSSLAILCKGDIRRALIALQYLILSGGGRERRSSDMEISSAGGSAMSDDLHAADTRQVPEEVLDADCRTELVSVVECGGKKARFLGDGDYVSSNLITDGVVGEGWMDCLPAEEMPELHICLPESLLGLPCQLSKLMTTCFLATDADSMLNELSFVCLNARLDVFEASLHHAIHLLPMPISLPTRYTHFSHTSTPSHNSSSSRPLFSDLHDHDAHGLSSDSQEEGVGKATLPDVDVAKMDVSSEKECTIERGFADGETIGNPSLAAKSCDVGNVSLLSANAEAARFSHTDSDSQSESCVAANIPVSVELASELHCSGGGSNRMTNRDVSGEGGTLSTSSLSCYPRSYTDGGLSFRMLSSFAQCYEYLSAIDGMNKSSVTSCPPPRSMCHILPGLEDCPVIDGDGDDSLRQQLVADVGIRSCRCLCQSVNNHIFLWRRQHSDGNNQSGISSIDAFHRHGMLSVDAFCGDQVLSYSVSELYRRIPPDILGALPLACRSNLKHVTLDYMPTLREICQAERRRQVVKYKRRFHHYLDSIGVFVEPSTILSLCHKFPPPAFSSSF